MKRRTSIFLNVLILTAATLSASSFDQIKLVENTDPTFGWSIFGLSNQGGTIGKNNDEIEIEVDWAKTSWGIGISHKLRVPINGRKLKGIQAEIKTVGLNKVQVHAGFSNKAGGNLSQDVRMAEDVSNDWKKFEFSANEMGIDLSELVSPTFGNQNWDNVKVVNLFFLNSERNGDLQKGTILVRNPVLIYSDENVYAKN